MVQMQAMIAIVSGCSKIYINDKDLAVQYLRMLLGAPPLARNQGLIRQRTQESEDMYAIDIEASSPEVPYKAKKTAETAMTETMDKLKKTAAATKTEAPRRQKALSKKTRITKEATKAKDKPSNGSGQNNNPNRSGSRSKRGSKSDALIGSVTDDETSSNASSVDTDELLEK